MSSALRQVAQVVQREVPKLTRGVRTSAPARGGYHYVSLLRLRVHVCSRALMPRLKTIVMESDTIQAACAAILSDGLHCALLLQDFEHGPNYLNFQDVSDTAALLAAGLLKAADLALSSSNPLHGRQCRPRLCLTG